MRLSLTTTGIDPRPISHGGESPVRLSQSVAVSLPAAVIPFPAIPVTVRGIRPNGSRTPIILNMTSSRMERSDQRLHPSLPWHLAANPNATKGKQEFGTESQRHGNPTEGGLPELEIAMVKFGLLLLECSKFRRFFL